MTWPSRLDVLFAIDRAGVVGPDGATHAGNLDLSFLRCVPNMVVMAPPTKQNAADAQHRPAAPRPGSRALSAWHRHRRGCRHRPVHPADRQGELRLQGSRIALLAFGSTVAAAEQVGRELGLSVVNMRFIKPLDRELLLAVAAQHEGLVTIEDNVVAGGAGSGVGELLNAEGVLRPILHLGLPDSYQHHASREDLLAEAGIDAAGIRAAVLKRWPQLAAGTPPLSAAG